MSVKSFKNSVIATASVAFLVVAAPNTAAAQDIDWDCESADGKRAGKFIDNIGQESDMLWLVHKKASDPKDPTREDFRETYVVKQVMNPKKVDEALGKFCEAGMGRVVYPSTLRDKTVNTPEIDRGFACDVTNPSAGIFKKASIVPHKSISTLFTVNTHEDGNDHYETPLPRITDHGVMDNRMDDLAGRCFRVKSPSPNPGE